MATEDETAEECESCGRSDDDLMAVHRIYLVPEVTRVDQVERWCASCRVHYPHDPDAHDPDAHEPDAHDPDAHDPDAHDPDAVV